MKPSLLLWCPLLALVSPSAQAQGTGFDYLWRVGLYDSPEFTRSDGFQASELVSRTESGYFRGYSNVYGWGDLRGDAQWVASAATGITTRVGFFHGPEFRNVD